MDVGVELAVLFKNGELPPKENPVEEAELDDDKLGKDGVVAVAVEGEHKEPKELIAAVVVVVVAGACEDENRGEPLLAPNGDEDVPNVPGTVDADDDDEDEAALPIPNVG